MILNCVYMIILIKLDIIIGKEHPRQRKQPIAKPWGRKAIDKFGKQRLVSWGMVSKRKDGRGRREK